MVLMVVRVLDLFCGGGGSSWGARAAGASIVCGVDADPVACTAYAKNFPASRSLQLKMTRNTKSDTLGHLGRIDMMLASPECTNHTHARGSRPVDENSKATARFVVNFARHLLPRWVVIENVIQMRAWQGYGRLIGDLEALGYKTASLVLDARDFGVPQQRRRLFVLCDLTREPPASVQPARLETPTVASILDPPGTWRSNPLYRPNRAAATLERAERAIAALGTGVPFLIVYYGSDAAGGWQTLDRPLRTITTIDRFGLVTWAAGEPRLRMLQVPELTRAMGFGSGYYLDGIGNRRDRIRLLGNGVAPPVMEAVVRALVGRRAAGETSLDSCAGTLNGNSVTGAEELSKRSRRLARANLALPDDEYIPAVCAE
jgi:DNA (cytosine-5)-methyltransferase 1